MKFKLQKLKFWSSKFETLEVQVSEVHISNIELPKVHVSDLHVLDIQISDIHISNFQVHVSIFQETVVVHVSNDRTTNVNETIKTPRDFNTNKDKLKQSGALIPTGFELDPNTISIHVLGGDEHDHVLKNYPQDVEGWVKLITTNA